ncbi:Ubiquitin-conjugating enzyme family protein [Aspergillus niger]|uniref:Ubiquitin-conjugating enzyme family protein n=1 Tax=Aspergillus niger TaxID=5061 RepID=A0A505HWN1_ASPNG|nr:Ubiquitin-conjugating enzyme family protein [Aspergillus niger]
MSLEATMIIVDNSESSRNGDYTSTRWQAQIDAVSVIHTTKMRVHPQSAVGLMSMGGKGPEVLSTFTSDFGGILAGLHRTKIHGTAHLSSSIQVAGTKKLEAFVENVKGGDGSNLAIIPPGPNLLSEELQVTPILGGDSSGADGAGPEGGDGAFGFEDAAENDPELAFALRLSLEEEKNRQEKEKRDREEQERKANLDNIPEEGSSGSKDKKEDGDKMDTA